MWLPNRDANSFHAIGPSVLTAAKQGRLILFCMPIGLLVSVTNVHAPGAALLRGCNVKTNQCGEAAHRLPPRRRRHPPPAGCAAAAGCPCAQQYAARSGRSDYARPRSQQRPLPPRAAKPPPRCSGLRPPTPSAASSHRRRAGAPMDGHRAWRCYIHQPTMPSRASLLRRPLLFLCLSRMPVRPAHQRPFLRKSQKIHYC
jgi:hypothetical protein